MNHARPSNDVHNLEHRILCALCSDTTRAELRGKVVRDLNGHPWHDSEHRIIYEALRSIPNGEGRAMREQLPAQATRMGFPDVDWDDYFLKAVPAEEELLKQVRELKQITAQPKGWPN